MRVWPAQRDRMLLSAICMIYFDSYALRETQIALHCDNCSGQNKNRYMLHYLAWRVIHGLHKDITLNFLIAGTLSSPQIGDLVCWRSVTIIFLKKIRMQETVLIRKINLVPTSHVQKTGQDTTHLTLNSKCFILMTLSSKTNLFLVSMQMWNFWRGMWSSATVSELPYRWEYGKLKGIEYCYQLLAWFILTAMH